MGITLTPEQRRFQAIKEAGKRRALREKREKQARELQARLSAALLEVTTRNPGIHPSLAMNVARKLAFGKG